MDKKEKMKKAKFDLDKYKYKYICVSCRRGLFNEIFKSVSLCDDCYRIRLESKENIG